MRRFRVKISLPGIVFILLTLILGGAAVNTGNNLLYLITSLMLALMGLSGMVSLLNLLGLSLDISPPQEVYAGQRALFSLSVKNKKILPSFLLQFSYPSGGAYLSYIPAKGRLTVPAWFIFHRRGWQKVGEIRVSSEFPVGFFERGFVIKEERQVLVYPRPIPCTDSFALEEDIDLRKAGYTIPEKEGDLRQLRKFYPGDTLRDVHWPATARYGKFIVKEYSVERPKALILTIDKRQDLEKNLGRLTYLICKLIVQNYPLGLNLPKLFIPPAQGVLQKKKLLEALATYEP